MWNYLFNPNFQESPSRTKRSPCKLIFTPERLSSHLEDICSIEILFIALVIARLTWYAAFPLHGVCKTRLRWIRIPLPISRAKLAFRGSFYCAFLCPENWTYLSPQNKCKLIPHSSSEKIMCSIEVNYLHCVERQHILHEESGALLFTALDNTFTWSTWSMVTSFESPIFIDPT